MELRNNFILIGVTQGSILAKMLSREDKDIPLCSVPLKTKKKLQMTSTFTS